VPSSHVANSSPSVEPAAAGRSRIDARSAARSGVETSIFSGIDASKSLATRSASYSASRRASLNSFDSSAFRVSASIARVSVSIERSHRLVYFPPVLSIFSVISRTDASSTAANSLASCRVYRSRYTPCRTARSRRRSEVFTSRPQKDKGHLQQRPQRLIHRK